MSKGELGSGIKTAAKKGTQSPFIMGGTTTAGGYFILDQFHKMIIEWNIPPATAAFLVGIAGLLYGGGAITLWGVIRSTFYADTRSEDRFKKGF